MILIFPVYLSVFLYLSGGRDLSVLFTTLYPDLGSRLFPPFEYTKRFLYTDFSSSSVWRQTFCPCLQPYLSVAQLWALGSHMACCSLDVPPTAAFSSVFSAALGQFSSHHFLDPRILLTFIDIFCLLSSPIPVLVSVYVALLLGRVPPESLPPWLFLVCTCCFLYLGWLLLPGRNHFCLLDSTDFVKHVCVCAF